MNNQTMFVVSELAAKKYKDDFAVGTHHISGTVTISVDAVVTRLPDEEAKQTSSLLTLKTLGQLLARLGATREAVLSALEQTWLAELEGETIEVSPEIEGRIEAARNRIEAVIERLPKKRKKGKTLIAGTISVLEKNAEAA